MNRIAFVIPGALSTRTGGYEYDRQLVSGLRSRGWHVDVRELAGSFPHPTPEALERLTAALASIADGMTVIVDGLALGAMPDQAERECRRLRLVALVHQPLADAVGLDRAVAARLEAGERRALAACRLAIVTGKSTALTLERYGVGRDRITIVEPGTDRAPLARGSGRAAPHLVCVAAVTLSKGHEILIEALANVPSRHWTLTCAGSLEREPETVERVRSLIALNELGGQVSLAGELDSDALSILYADADLFVLATLHETYGMAVAEALARGLPVISTQTGAIPELIGDGAGLIVPSGNRDLLCAAMTTAIGDDSVRAGLAAGARRVRDRLPTWDTRVDHLMAILEPIGRDGRVNAF